MPMMSKRKIDNAESQGEQHKSARVGPGAGVDPSHTKQLRIRRLRGLWKVPLACVRFKTMRRVDLTSEEDWPHDPSYHIGALDNGLRYYIKINRTPKQKAELRLVVQAGSLHEEHEERGLAHFLEHLCFRETRNFKDGEIIKYLEKQGVAFGPDVNAMTTFDSTVYQLTVPTDEAGVLDQAFQVLGDWAGGVLPTEEALANEKKVVLEEWRMGQGSHHRLSLQLLAEQLKGSRYIDRMPIGSFEVIEKLTVEQVKRFYDRWYIPQRMAVMVVGDFESTEEVKALIQRHLSPVAQRSPTSVPPPPPFTMDEHPVPVPRGVQYLLQSDAEESRCSIGIFTKRPYRKASDRKSVESNLLEGFAVDIFNSRLDKPVNTTSVAAECAADVGKMEETLRLLLQEVYRFAEHGATEREVRLSEEDRRSAVVSTMAERHDLDSDELLEDCIGHFMEGESIIGVALESRSVLELLPTLSTVERVSAKAQEVFSLGHNALYNIVMVEDAALQEGFTQAQVERIVAEVEAEARAGKLGVWEEEELPSELWSEEMVGATSGGGLELLASRRMLPSVNGHELTLTNGIRVVLKQTDFESDSVYLRGFCQVGTANFGDEHLEASVAASVARESGYGMHKMDVMEELLAGKLCSCKLHMRRDSRQVEGESSQADLEVLMQIMGLVFTCQQIDEAAWLRLKGRLMERLQHQAKSPMFHLQKRLTELTTGGHSFFRTLHAVDVENMSFATVRRCFFDAFSDIGEFVLVLVGSLPDLDTVTIPWVLKYFGSLPSPSNSIPDGDTKVEPLSSRVAIVPTPVFPAGIWREMIRSGITHKATVAIVFPVQLPDHESVEAVLCVAAVQKVLQNQLRVELGGVYSLSCSLHKYSIRSLASTITILFSCKPDTAESLADAVLATITSLRELDVNRVAEIMAGAGTMEDGDAGADVGGLKGDLVEPTVLDELDCENFGDDREEQDADVDWDGDGNAGENKEEEEGVAEGKRPPFDLSQAFGDACHAVVMNQRKTLQSEVNENGYWESLIFNTCLMYDSKKGADLLLPALPGNMPDRSDLDAVLAWRIAHVPRVLDERCAASNFLLCARQVFDMSNYVRVCLLPERDESEETAPP